MAGHPLINLGNVNSGTDAIIIGSCGDVYFPGGQPTPAALFWLIRAREQGEFPPELEGVLAALATRRLIVLGCADLELLDEICETLVAALGERVGGVAVFGSELPKEPEISIQSWFRQLANSKVPGEARSPTASLILLDGTDSQYAGALNAIGSLRSRELDRLGQDLQAEGKYLVVLSSYDLFQNVNAHLVGQAWHRISFLKWRLQHDHPDCVEELLEDFRGQQVRGLWPDKESEVYQALSSAIVGLGLRKAIKERPQNHVQGRKIDGAIPIGTQDRKLETAALFVAVFLPGLSRSEYDEIICGLLDGDTTVDALGLAGVERWKENSAAVLAACGIAALPRRSNRGTGESQIAEVQIASDDIREYYRLEFTTRAFLSYLRLSEKIFGRELIFDSRLRIRTSASRLLAEISVSFPQEFDDIRIGGWIQSWMERATAGVRPTVATPRSLAKNLEGIFRVSTEVRSFAPTARKVLLGILASEQWRIGVEILGRLRNLEGLDVYGIWLDCLKSSQIELLKSSRRKSGSAKDRSDVLVENLENHIVSGSAAFDEAFAKLMPYLSASGASLSRVGLDSRAVLLSAVIRSLRMSRFDFDVMGWGHAMAGAISFNPDRLHDLVSIVFHPRSIEELGAVKNLIARVANWLVPGAIAKVVPRAIRKAQLDGLENLAAVSRMQSVGKNGSLLVFAWLLAELACTMKSDAAEEARYFVLIRTLCGIHLGRAERNFVGQIWSAFEAAHLAVHTALRQHTLSPKNSSAETLLLVTQGWASYRVQIGKLRSEARGAACRS